MNIFYYVLFWVCVVGLCLGSFYNVVILRSLTGESIAFPASKCPKCGNKLKPWHNIPVISYLFLRGKCAFCKEKISIQYPIVELLTMILFGISFYKFGFSFATLFAFLWISCLIIMTGTDLKERLVDCNFAIVMGISGILYSGLNGAWTGVLNSVLGLIAGIVILEIIARSGYLIAKTRAMGEADTFVAAAFGAIVGVQNIIWVLVYGLIASMVVIIPSFFYERYKANDKLTCIVFLWFILSVLIFKTILQNYIMLGIVLILAVFLVVSILRKMRNAENRTVLPYVPALSAGFLYYLFFVL